MARKLLVSLCLIAALAASGCGAPDPPAVNFVPINDAPGSPPAEAQLVARVNGQPILLADFQKRVQQFEQVELTRAGGSAGAPEPAQAAQIEQQVLNGLIDQAIIAQAAQARGIAISDEALAQKIADMRQSRTDAEFKQWLALNKLTEAEFKATLRSQLSAAELFASIADRAPTSTEQVHARHILVTDLRQAQALAARLQAGEPFVELAQQESTDEQTRANGGDLGWFPRGIQAVPPQVEAVAFSLAPGQVSPVIESVLGYHLVKVERKEPDRPLTPRHRQQLQVAWFNQWLAQQRASAQIERYTN